MTRNVLFPVKALKFPLLSEMVASRKESKEGIRYGETISYTEPLSSVNLKKMDLFHHSDCVTNLLYDPKIC